jgi:hypothetical protein
MEISPDSYQKWDKTIYDEIKAKVDGKIAILTQLEENGVISPEEAQTLAELPKERKTIGEFEANDDDFEMQDGANGKKLLILR